MGWYAKTSAKMMAKRQGVDVPDDQLEEWRSAQTAGAMQDARDGIRKIQDDADARKGQKANRKAERKARRKGQLEQS